jgi:hypothetical protein
MKGVREWDPDGFSLLSGSGMEWIHVRPPRFTDPKTHTRRTATGIT